jgi:hypothetical protein
MNPNDPMWQRTEEDNHLARGAQPDPLDELWPPQGEYLTQAEMAEFLDTLAELLHRMVEVCTTLAKGATNNQSN